MQHNLTTLLSRRRRYGKDFWGLGFLTLAMSLTPSDVQAGEVLALMLTLAFCQFRTIDWLRCHWCLVHPHYKLTEIFQAVVSYHQRVLLQVCGVPILILALFNPVQALGWLLLLLASSHFINLGTLLEQPTSALYWGASTIGLVTVLLAGLHSGWPTSLFMASASLAIGARLAQMMQSQRATRHR